VAGSGQESLSIIEESAQGERHHAQGADRFWMEARKEMAGPKPLDGYDAEDSEEWRER
jgi:hypothetical protein